MAFSAEEELLAQACGGLCVGMWGSLCARDGVGWSERGCVCAAVFVDFLCQCGVFHLLFGGRHRIDLGECALVFCAGAWGFS